MRDGRGAALGPPPSQIPSQGSFGLRVTYQDGIPLKSCGAAQIPRASSVAAPRGVRTNSNSTSLHPVRTGGDGCCCCCCCGLQACSSYRHYLLIPPFSASQCVAVSAVVLPPVPADAQNLTGQSMRSVQKKKTKNKKLTNYNRRMA